MRIRRKSKDDPDKKNEAKDEIVPSISYLTLFRFASKVDKLLIALAFLASTIAGVSLTYAITIVAGLIQSMIDYEKRMISNETFLSHVHGFAVKGTSVGFIVLFGTYMGSAFMNVTAINQIFKIRQEYLKSILNQDFSYFDTRQSGDFASKTSENVIKLEEGIGDKLSAMVFYVACGLSSVIMACMRGWKLALLCLVSAPVSFVLVGLTGKFAQNLSKKEAEESGRASAIAEEVLSSIRTVYAFNGQQKELERYKVPLSAARKTDIKKELLTGISMSLLFMCIFSSYGLAFYFGTYLIVHEPKKYNADVMFSVFIGVINGLQYLGMTGMLISSFGSAQGAGAHIFHLIDMVPSINPLLDRGIKPHAVQGKIQFQNVVFRYPARPNITVLDGFNLCVERGQSAALVGHSGCGKSTAMQLVSRYYDVIGGKVLLDGHDVRDLSVRWLRAQIGLVGQEPVLFNTTVRENIRYGREDASDEDIEAAARQANAHRFIRKLPKGYDTLVGERGAALSGGQKQRIAIARALLRNPPVLLLDEATSALDTSSEAKVQKALNTASKGRTTLIVAHRLSTIRNVDVIYVLKHGKVVEVGNHEELMKMQGSYYAMVQLQQPVGSEEVTIHTDSTHDYDAVSVVSELDDDDEDEFETKTDAKNDKPPPLSFCTLIKLNKPEWKSISIGSFFSAITGLAMPIFMVVFGMLLGAMSSSDVNHLMNSVASVSLICIVLGLIVGATNLIQTVCFGIAGAYLTERLRVLMFGHLIKQDIAFFDEQANGTGALCARLSSDAAYVRQATGQRIGVVLQSVGAVGGAFLIAAVSEWRIALVALAFAPLLAVVLYYETKLSLVESFGNAEAVKNSTKIAFEAVSNVRTVASLQREQRFVEQYVAQLAPALGPAKRSAHCRGIVSGLSRSIFNFINATTLTFGGHIIVSEGAQYQRIFVATQSLQMAAGQVQNLSTYYPDFQTGFTAAARAVALLKTEPNIKDPQNPITPFISTGDARFKGVEFRYPTRPGVKVLRGLDLEINRGETVALVGESGCGKSTVVSLLQRYYDPEAGTVELNGIPLSALLLEDVRGNFGLVSQEPVLFDRSVRENIAYGDNARAPTDAEIVDAAKHANIHDFVQTLPQGYDSNIGAKGVQLSGGQKQRIAIARALVRKPKILLLDEATSALDTESEKVVQEALDRAKEGRTCVTIAHRLSTIRDADAICVIRRGRVAERGTHAQLIETKGLYYELYTKGYT